MIFRPSTTLRSSVRRRTNETVNTVHPELLSVADGLPKGEKRDEYRHHVSGFLAYRDEAEGALSRLVERGVPSAQIQLFDADSGSAVNRPKGESDEVLTNVLVNGAIGTAAGANAGVEHKDGWLSELVRDAVASGQVVLVAQTRSAQETDVAREVVGDAVGEFKDVAATD